MKKSIYILLIVVTVGCVLPSCEKEIDVKLPVETSTLVVEGSIEPGVPPIVQLSMSQGYFDPIDLDLLEESQVKNASVYITVDGVETKLDLICTSFLPPELLPLAAEIIGMDVATLSEFNFCLYTSMDPNLFGQVGKTYDLRIVHDGNEYTSSTSLLKPTPLDTVYFELYAQFEDLGMLKGQLTDEAGVFNNYRWTTKRINRYPNGEVKDRQFIAPVGSVTDDKFFDGLSFDFRAFRGSAPNSTKEDDNPDSDERGLYSLNDTVVVKFSSIDKGVYEFIQTFEDEYSSAGSPFSSPTTIRTNIEGGALGVWAGYSPVYDTVVCKL